MMCLVVNFETDVFFISLQSQIKRNVDGGNCDKMIDRWFKRCVTKQQSVR